MVGLPEVPESDVGNAARSGVQHAPCLELAPDPVAHGRVGKALLRGSGTAGLDPRRNRDQESRRSPFVGIRIESHVEALGPGIVDQGQHLVRGPGERGPMVEVGDVGRRLTPSADLDRLAEWIQEPIAKRVADVRVVDAAEAARFGGEPRQLGRRGIRTGRVVEAGRDPERTLLHALAEHRSHTGQGRIVGHHFLPADCRDPERSVADEERDVDADLPIEPGEIARDRVPVRAARRRMAVQAGVQLDECGEVVWIGERCVGVAVDADDLGRDALPNLRFMERLGQDRETGVAVEVDEARRDHAAGGIDRSAGSCSG